MSSRSRWLLREMHCEIWASTIQEYLRKRLIDRDRAKLLRETGVQNCTWAQNYCTVCPGQGLETHSAMPLSIARPWLPGPPM